MKKIFDKIFSMGVGIVLLLIFAISCALATFIEKDFGTASALSLIYNAWWFGLVQVWLVVIIVYNLFKYKLFTKNKFPALVFHFSFLFILLGSILTRYYGFEGSIHIREGEKENIITSLSSYVQLKAIKDKKTYSTQIQKIFSIAKGSFIYSLLNTNNFNLNLDINGEKASFKYEKILVNPKRKIIEDKDGEALVSLVVNSNHSKPSEILLKKGEMVSTHEMSIDYVSSKKSSAKLQFHIFDENNTFYFLANKEVSWYKMSDNTKGVFAKNTKIAFEKKRLYTIGEMNIVPKILSKNAKLTWVSHWSDRVDSKMLLGTLSYRGKSKEVALRGFGRGVEGVKTKVSLAGEEFYLQWGAKLYELPFFIELIDFQLQRYAGSMSPSSYASEVKLIDEKNAVNLPYRIYMNHVLDYLGFRFFQSSYDQDEQGSILSVNKDPGKFPTYFGYTLLFLGLLLNIINPNSRFAKLSNSISKEVAIKLSLFVLLCSQTLVAQDVKFYDKAHCDYFATILSQNHDGRIRPVDTTNIEVLLKIHGKSTFKNLSANQVILSMITNPIKWQKIPIIKVHDKKLKQILGIKGKYASFDDFFEKNGDKRYKLIEQIDTAKRKKASQRNLFDKDLIKVDERLNISYLVYTGEFLKIFPVVGDKSKKWISPTTAFMYLANKQDSKDISLMLDAYFKALQDGAKSGDYSKANKAVDKIKSYQKQYANDIIPSKSKINAEISFNHLQIFVKLFPVYILLGFILLFGIFLKMIFPNLGLKKLKTIILFSAILGFITHTFALGLRWYISGHAPWSNGYESMVYISWALILCGLIFAKKSFISLALTLILSGISLFVAHLSWMDPQITNLVPVLKSYWLSIHVSVITASYGFLGLCAMLGFFTLLLFILINPAIKDKRNEHIKKSIDESTKINEMAMILGLTLLTIGNFLGGIWANESWGRYWGWDAKETWALISILIYAAIVHLRFIKALNNQFVFALCSMFAYWSIIMTYFGVNFYLAGMHSYASGDPVPIPKSVLVIFCVMSIVSVLAFFKRKIATKL